MPHRQSTREHWLVRRPSPSRQADSVPSTEAPVYQQQLWSYQSLAELRPDMRKLRRAGSVRESLLSFLTRSGSHWRRKPSQLLHTTPSAALRSGAVVAVVHASVPELRLAHHPIAGVSRAHVREISLVVRNPEDCSDNRGCARKYRADVVDHLVELRAGKYRSNNSKMRRYSSAHDEGLTNA